MSKTKITASDIRRAIHARFPSQEYAVMFEVADSTGAQRRRYADAVVMSLWPSRGLEIHGIEIKVSSSDWKREAADPAKAESVARYCDRWSVYTAPGVIRDLVSVPPAWGVEEFDGKSFKTIKKAEKTDAQPLSRSFVASMLRRSDGVVRAMLKDAERKAEAMAREALQKERDQIDAVVKSRVEARTRKFENAQAVIDAINEATGENIMNTIGRDRVLRAVGLMASLDRLGFGSEHSMFQYHLGAIASACQQALEVYEATFAAKDASK